MKGGIISTIRINPKDCQSILDVMQKAGIPTAGMSFASMASLTLQSLLSAARSSGTIPEPDEFQYLNRMTPYLNARHHKKLQVTKAIGELGSNLKMPAIHKESPVEARLDGMRSQAAREQVHHTVTTSAAEPAQSVDDEMIRYAGRRLTELLAKKDAADDGAEIIWSVTDQEEFDKYYQLIYPDG